MRENLRCEKSHVREPTSMGFTDHIIIKCDLKDPKYPAPGLVSAKINVVEWGGIKHCTLDWMRSIPARRGLGSASMPLIVKHLSEINCDEISGTSTEEAIGFWSKYVDMDPKERKPR